MTTLSAGIFLACFVLVLALNGIRDHFDRKARLRDRHLAALRGNDPYEADWDWRRRAS